MKQSLYAAMLLLLLPLSAICQAESLTRRFVIEHKQTTQSFSVMRSLNSLSDNPRYLADTNGYSVFLPPGDKQHKPGGYGITMTFIESISWQLLYATNVLVAYELILTTRDTALRGKPYSWIPEEAFVAVGWLLKSYWSPYSLLFNPGDQLEVSQDEPFVITTMTLPGQNQQQSDHQNPPSESSGQQTSGTTNHVGGSVTRPLSSGSGSGNDGPEQVQHTLGLDCYVDSCYGVCKLRQASNGGESAEGTLTFAESPTEHTHHETRETQPSQPHAHEDATEEASKTETSSCWLRKRSNEDATEEASKDETGQKAKKPKLEEVDEHSESLVNAVPGTEIDESNETAGNTVSEIIEHMNSLITILIENDVHYKTEPPTPDIQAFRNAIELLEYLDPSDISQGSEMTDSNCDCSHCSGYSDTWYIVYYRDNVLFTVTQTESETRFAERWTSGESAKIKTEDLFNELYYAPGAPGYQSTKNEYEAFKR
ncbi:hypothetical protein [Endozoicomonas sp. SESOKO2]|uniref:hypothetical protein n=1 Tax=Endozoicomonas sp. SESOKO2 TaxID=2828743 RepID=UPI002148CACD|nr:hypothetical protein [Endozoicomonas sp. SESOKO2]